MNHPHLHQTLHQTLNFHRVEYPIALVQHWLDFIDLKSFVFDFYFPETEDPGRPILLCCFARDAQGYKNPFHPDVLAPYAGEVQVCVGPVKLTGSLVLADDMRSFLAVCNPADNYLLFTPTLDAHRQVQYIIRALQRTDTGDVVGDTSITTNPSPPATAPVIVEVG